MNIYYIIWHITPRTFILYKNRLDFKIFIMFQQDIFTFPPVGLETPCANWNKHARSPVTAHAVYALSNQHNIKAKINVYTGNLDS